MRNLHRILLLAILAASASAAEPLYTIRINRPDKVGDRLEIGVAAATRYWTRYTVGGEPQQPQERVLAVDLRGRIDILEVNEKGETLRMSCTVEKCTRIEGTDQKEQDLLPKGSVILVEAGDPRTKLSLKSGQLARDQEYAISLVLNLSSPGAATADDVYNTSEPRAVGATWPISAETVARDTKRWKLEIDPKDVSGSATLKGIRTEDGVPFLELSTQLKIARARSSDPERKAIPEGMNSLGMSRETNTTSLVPVDPALPHLRVTRIDTLKESAEGKLGPRQRDTRLETIYDSSFELRVSPVAE